ncbi:unnamed protein product [Adineta ricciae]|uniref:1,4-alpha-glucan branching enzyme n=1 Tax=Adineta ricciae TaxID=249248 RepID=A0A814ETR3_ADIRI|nr:unnamed protein product [Adineta ricciae]CAF1424606.1 unnamed protein product [Adineta ricciae]
MTHRKLYESRGAQYRKESETTSFCLYAPNARSVWLILTAYDTAAPPGQIFLYLIDDYHGRQMLRTDPISFSVVHIFEVNQVHSVVHDETAYQWNDQNWLRQRSQTDPLRSPSSIYEIQPKSWKSSTYKPLKFRQIAAELVSYCQQMGFTHVEIIGILEHTHQGGRGYQVSNFFAPYRHSGTCDDFEYLIDLLHQNNIGVILDWIPTHYHRWHQSHFYSTSLHASSSSPWETRRFLFASALYYLDRLHIDAIRFDAISQMIRRQHKDIPSAISFLHELNQTIHTYYPGVLCIAEETEGYPNLKTTMSFDLKWNIGWSYDARNLLRTPYAERPQHWKQKVLDTLNWSRWGPDKMILTLSHNDTDSGEHNKIFLLDNDMRLVVWSYDSYGRCSCTTHVLQIQHPQFWQYGELDFSLIYEYGLNLVIAYDRGIYNNRRIVIIHNFSNRGYKTYNIPLPKSDPNVACVQNVTEIFNTDHPKYSGSGLFENQQLIIQRHNDGNMLFKLTIPPLSTIILEEILI